ncbi:MAG: pantetheine-phosphate adenylyltransferase [Tissierellia bacterium]|nr:pantetheine-phosphate adenylyltransferase [Tissierellia bacterium]
MKVIYPGSFDPITNGHLDIISRACKQFEHVVVAVLKNNNKKALFSIEERIELIKESCKDLENLEVDSFSGLLIDYAKMKESKAIIRGLRAISDYENEMQMSLANRYLSDEIETFLMVSGTDYTYLSSSLVKEIASFGGDVSNFVPTPVLKALKTKFYKL